jgi:methyl-accepting chemotaxis protein
MDFAKVMNTIDFIGKKSQSVRELLTLLQQVSERMKVVSENIKEMSELAQKGMAIVEELRDRDKKN